MPKITIHTPPCPNCGRGGTILANEDGYNRWKVDRELIQNALPDLNSAEREQLLTGIHSQCWIKLFSKDRWES